MTSPTDPAVTAESDRASAPESVLWHHAAFCRLGLPVEPRNEAWRRDGAGASLRITPGTAGEMLPDGPGLRLILAFLCDAALRAGGPTVSLGADAAALAATMGLAPGAAAPLAEQVERLLAAKITTSVDDGPELSVLDARSRPRGGGWPANLKLNARFLASLSEHAVPLDRAILRALSGSAEAMDAHGWTREALARAGEDATVTAPWPELMARFGEPGAEPTAFREAFESALRMVFEADLSIELAVDDEGVSLRRARPEEAAAPEPAQPEPAPIAPAPVPPPLAAEPAPAPRPPEPAPQAPPAAPPRAEEARPHEDHSREERPRDDRQREDRQRDDRPREDRRARRDEDDRRPRRDEEERRPRRDDEDRRPRREDDDRRPRRDEAGEGGAADAIVDDMIRLRSHLTGLPQVVWLRRGHGDENILVGVTPGTRLDTERLTILMVEPIVMQVSGGLGQSDFERVSAWVMANRDLIDEFWEGGIGSAEEVTRRVRKAPGPSWR